MHATRLGLISLEPNLSSNFVHPHAALAHHQQWAASAHMSLEPTTICGATQIGATLTGANHDHLRVTNLAAHTFDAIDQVKPITKLIVNNLLEPMQSVDSTLDYYFTDFWLHNGDERTAKLPFMTGAPWKLMYATMVYLYLIKWLLPKIMQRFKPLELNWCIRVYNLFMVLSNIYAFYHGARILAWGSKCFGCEVIDHRDYSPQAMELLHYGWLFFLSRLVEWLDTIFFVLRKKERQVTKLHVFHHSFVPLISWVYLKFHPGHTVAFFPFVNSFVHSIMYTYYLLATFGPAVQPFLWWKKYLTSLQIAQFVLILIQLATIPLSSNDKCQYPRGFLYVAFAGAILFLWLFYTYYIDTYHHHALAPKQPQANKCATRPHHSTNKCHHQLAAKLPSKVSYRSREGSSRALSDSIDDVLDSFADEATSPKTYKLD